MVLDSTGPVKDGRYWLALGGKGSVLANIP